MSVGEIGRSKVPREGSSERSRREILPEKTVKPSWFDAFVSLCLETYHEFPPIDQSEAGART
jgi:hypothetical protein